MTNHRTARRIYGALCCLCALTLSAGCATSGQMDSVEARVNALERERDQLRETMNADMEKFERLHAMLITAEATLRESGADLGMRLERIEQDVPRVRGELETLRFKMRELRSNMDVVRRELSDRLGSTAIFLPADIPTEADPLWQRAEASVTARELQEARALYELFAASFADDPRAPLAHFRMGQAFEGAGDLEAAIKSYQLVHDRFEASPEAPRAIMRIAQIFIGKKDCNRARNLLRFVASNYKSSPEGAEAQKRSKTVLRECK